MQFYVVRQHDTISIVFCVEVKILDFKPLQCLGASCMGGGGGGGGYCCLFIIIIWLIQQAIHIWDFKRFRLYKLS